MTDSLHVAELLATRLCHDITGPIGAVNNGVEFLEEEGFSMNSDALKLITDSGKEAVARLQFYRQAYGSAKDIGGACLNDRKALVEAFLHQTKVALDWPDLHTDAADISISQVTAKLIMNLVILVANALIRGGTLSIRLEKIPGGKRIHLTGEGDHVKFDDAVIAAIESDVDEAALVPKTVQAYLTRQLAQRIGAMLTFTHEKTRVSFIIERQRPIHG